MKKEKSKKDKPKKDGIKYGLCVPLIGGMAVANEKVTGEEPSFILSYEAFASNDAHCVNRYPNTDYILADPETNDLPDGVDLFEEVDFVSAVCPCAGLSMLNSNNGGSNKARGADAAQNDWMYKSARLVLEKVRPKVFWGENAPGLFTKMGDKVVQNLREIGKEFGYSFSMIKTDTYLHGIPQHRQRTFYFFWRDSDAPLLNYYEREAPLLKDYLDQIPEGTSYMDQAFGIGNISENGWFKYAKAKGWSTQQLIESRYKTMFEWVRCEGLMDDCYEWCEANNELKIAKFITHCKTKLADNKGWWDGTPLIFHEATNAIIAKNSGIVRPGKERGITVREAMHLMGLPHDFEMVGSGWWNHICQNVPVTTAADWTAEVVRFIKGEITEFGGKFVKQNNTSKKIEYAENLQTAKALF